MKSTATLALPLRRERVLHPVLEEDPVRESGEGVVEGLVLELALKADALADVARREHQSADVGVVEQVGDDGLA